jgi:hypothetical protein
MSWLQGMYMYIQRGTSRGFHALRRYANSTTSQQDLFRDPRSYQLPIGSKCQRSAYHRIINSLAHPNICCSDRVYGFAGQGQTGPTPAAEKKPQALNKPKPQTFDVFCQLACHAVARLKKKWSPPLCSPSSGSHESFQLGSTTAL